LIVLQFVRWFYRMHIWLAFIEWPGRNVNLELASAPAWSARLEHDPEKWEPVFGKDHAQTKC
jgi:hypothetical protein